MIDNRSYNERRTMKIEQNDKRRTLAERVLISSITSHLRRVLRKNTFKIAFEVLQEGIVNADDTVFIERAQPHNEWAFLLVTSMAMLLSQRASAMNLTEAQHAQMCEAFALIGVRP